MKLCYRKQSYYELLQDGNIYYTFVASFQTLQEVTEKRNIDSKWASRNCQDGLYIPLIFSALGFNLNTNKIFAGKDIEDKTIGKNANYLQLHSSRIHLSAFNPGKNKTTCKWI